MTLDPDASLGPRPLAEIGAVANDTAERILVKFGLLARAGFSPTTL